MAARKPRRPKRPEPPPTGVLDWTRGHWAGVEKRCRYCPGLTPLRDSDGKPAHKVCAEEAIARQVEEYAEAWENERLREQ
ncbi:hypothetical protein [Streptomyces griseofuscus]|uniref:Uncharacterized protein n=1 Tax=Streptomyces griseofuscus TaxID=146922 RepID=A0A7H1Q3H3_9ACTN|nr:hypothetical protein [Streptomyces griseofuscus]QNT94853.1 hypothetical protein HEP81_04580 [Streptomyces griseofuscus]